MGTRSLTYVYDGPLVDGDVEQKPIVCMYRQYDGYPSGHGQELTEFLSKMTVTNGYNSTQEAPTWANGMGCLAAQLVARFKEGIGGIYLQEPTLGQDSGQEYEYHIYTADGENIRVKIVDVAFSGPNTDLFDGSATEALTFCTRPDEGG